VNKRSFVDRISKSRKGKVEEPCMEMIPMAYSSSFLDNKNITEEKLTFNSNTNDSSSNNINPGKISQRKKEWIKQPKAAEPKRIVNNLKVQRERKKHRYKNEPENNPEKKQVELNQEEDFNRSNNQFYLLEKFVCHSNLLAQPNEVSSTEDMSNNIQDETIPMACS
jgi:hypothetical protein